MSHKAQRQPGQAGAGKTANLKRADLNHTKHGSANQYDNLDGITAAALEQLITVGFDIVAKHGLDPCTKVQTAAHEAGHVIVARALGAVVRSAHIKQLDGYWTGGTKYHMHPAEGTSPGGFTPKDVFNRACICIAGVVAEKLAGTFHPASSIDERCEATEICSILDGMAQVPEGTTAGLVDDTVVKILNDYRMQFDAVRHHLERQHRLTSAEANRMLAKVGAP